MAVLLILAAAPAYAQIAAALGKPLPSPDLAAGTVTVRVVAGAPSAPVTGVEVTLTVNGTPREARTDSAGRANFPGLPVGATVQAKTLDAEKKECDPAARCTSDEFQVPAQGGARVLLTTKPWQAGGGGAPFAGGAGGGMPAPRQMSGEPRYDQAFEPGTITAIVTYNNLALADGKMKDSDPPVGVVVALIGYQSDNKTVVTTLPTDAKGEAVFTGLDRTGNTVYFAMAQLPRNNAVDRLASTAMQLGSEGGVKVILSSEKKDSTADVIDDLNRIAHQEPGIPEGKVRVLLSGVPQMATVNLVDAATGTVLSKGQPGAGPPDPANIQPAASWDAKPDLPAGTFDLEVRGGPAGTDEPLPNVPVRLDLDDKQPSKEAAEFMASDKAGAATDNTGTARVAGIPNGKWKAVLTLNGKNMVSQPFDLSASGGKLTVNVRWEATGRPQVVFDYVPRANQVVYAETTMRDIGYRSAPFQGVAGHGTMVEIGVLPRLMFKFHMGGFVEDAFLAVQGQFEIDNYSWSPYAGGPDGLVIPLPKGFKGAVLMDKQDQQDIAVDTAEGFRVVRPLGPGKRSFRVGFSLPIDDGNVKWAMDLPFGAWESSLNLLEFPGMSVQVPSGVHEEPGETESGQKLIMLPRISIEPKHAMVLTVNGLPSAPGWKKWVPRVIGTLVITMMLTGLVLALLARRREAGADPSRESRRAKLLDELVALDKVGKDNKRREAVIGELESLWDE